MTQTGATHPDGDQRGGIEGREQHGVTKHEDEAGGQGDLQGAPEGENSCQSLHLTKCEP